MNIFLNYAKLSSLITEFFFSFVKNNRQESNTSKKEHGRKGFVMPTKSFVEIGITKIFCYKNNMFSSINKTFGCCSKIFGCSNKKNICCP